MCLYFKTLFEYEKAVSIDTAKISSSNIEYLVDIVIFNFIFSLCHFELNKSKYNNIRMNWSKFLAIK